MSPQSLEALAPLSGAELAPLSALPTAQAAAEPAAPGFVDWVARQAESLNTELLQAEHGVQQLAAGAPVNVHEVMLQLEQARLSFQLMAQVRSRVLEAYQEVMRMQV